MLIFCLNETFRMIMLTLLKFCLSGYDKNTCFGRSIANISAFFFGAKKMVALDTSFLKKLNPHSIIFFFGGGGRVHSKVCWLIVYKQIVIMKMTFFRYIVRLPSKLQLNGSFKVIYMSVRLYDSIKDFIFIYFQLNMLTDQQFLRGGGGGQRYFFYNQIPPQSEEKNMLHMRTQIKY